MDGNFVDNDFDILIESADIQPEDYRDITSKKKKQNLRNKYDRFALRIKFSHALDPSSVNQDSATLLSGNKPVKASVKYDKKKRSIIINPKSKYLRNTLYMLKLSGKVMSERGRSLRQNKFFAFKQDGKSLNFYKGFKGNVYGQAPDTLEIQRGVLLPFLFVFSAIVLVSSYFYGSKPGLAIGTVLVFIAAAAALIDSISDVGRSHKEYIYGAKLYNSGYFFESIECFELAIHLNPDNKYAQRGLDAAIRKCTEAVD